MSTRYLEGWAKEYAVDVDEERGMARILVPQESDDFVTIRQGGLGISNGASSVIQALGLSVYGPPKLHWRYKLYPWKGITDDGEPIPLDTPDAKTQENFDHGHRFEPVTRKVWTLLSGEKRRCFEGCVWRMRRGDLFYKNECDRWELEHVSPDGNALAHEPSRPITRREIMEARTCTDEEEKQEALKRLRDRMLPMDNVIFNMEFKNPRYHVYDEVPKEHVAQMQDQMRVTGAPYGEYCATHIDGDTQKLTGVLYARVHRSSTYVQWIEEHMRNYSMCLYRHQEPWWGMVTNEREIPPVKIEYLAKGAPETLGLPEDVVQQGLLEAERCEGLFW